MNDKSVETPHPLRWPAWTSGPAAWRVAAAVAIAFIVLYTVPWKPAEEAPIGAFDFSWMLLLHDAVATARQFGKEIILPQGPLGFVGNSVYDPRTYWVLIAARTAIALAVFRVMWEAARKLVPQPAVALGGLVAIISLIGRSPDHFFPACAVLLLFHYYVVNGRRMTATSYVMLAFVLAAGSLIKVNQPFFAVAAAGTITLDRLRQRDKWFFVPAVAYVLAVLAFYFAARQSPASLGAFLWGWFQVTAGHADAVGLAGPTIDAVVFVIIAGAVVGVIGVYAWNTWKVDGLPLTAGTAAILALLYKHSFMRQDLMHVHMGPMVALATAILYAAPVWKSKRHNLRVASVVVIALASAFLTSLLSNYVGEGMVAHVAKRVAGNASAAASHVIDRPRHRREWEEARKALRDENPIAVDKIRGVVDVYPHRQDVVFAYGLRYEPRPVVSSLVATSPILADVNAKHLRGPAAPETVLFDVELVDRNFPTILDGQSLPELLTRYDVIDSSGAMLVLRRTPTPRSYRFTPLLTRAARFEEPIPIPEPGDAPVWARLRFKRRAAGQIRAMLYKPALVGIEVHTRDGEGRSYRLLPTLAEEQGFLLSPLIADRGAYARLASKTAAKDLAPLAVSTITI